MKTPRRAKKRVLVVVTAYNTAAPPMKNNCTGSTGERKCRPVVPQKPVDISREQQAKKGQALGYMPDISLLLA